MKVFRCLFFFLSVCSWPYLFFLFVCSAFYCCLKKLCMLRKLIIFNYMVQIIFLNISWWKMLMWNFLLIVLVCEITVLYIWIHFFSFVIFGFEITPLSISHDFTPNNSSFFCDFLFHSWVFSPSGTYFNIKNGPKSQLYLFFFNKCPLKYLVNNPFFPTDFKRTFLS